MIIEKIVHAEGDDIRLASELGIPKVLFLGKGFHILSGTHTAAGKIIDLDACLARHELSPRVVENVIIMMTALPIERFKFTRGKAVADTADGFEDAAKSAVCHEPVKRFFIFVGQRVHIFLYVHIVFSFQNMISYPYYKTRSGKGSSVFLNFCVFFSKSSLQNGEKEG